MKEQGNNENMLKLKRRAFNLSYIYIREIHHLVSFYLLCILLVNIFDFNYVPFIEVLCVLKSSRLFCLAIIFYFSLLAPAIISLVD